MSRGRSKNMERMKAPVCLALLELSPPRCHLITLTVNHIPLCAVFVHSAVFMHWGKNWVMFTLHMCWWWAPLRALSTCISNSRFSHFCLCFIFKFRSTGFAVTPFSLTFVFTHLAFTSRLHQLTPPHLSAHLLPQPPHPHPSLRPSATASRIQIYWVQWSASLPPLPPISWSWMTIEQETDIALIFGLCISNCILAGCVK